MKIKYVVVAIIMVLTLSLSMPMIYLPTTVKADPGTLTVPGEYTTISAAIAAASPGDTILVSAGTYHETLQITTNSLNITAVGDVIVEGGAMFNTHYGDRQATIFVTGASNVVLNGLDIEGSGLGLPSGTKSYAVLYESSTGTVQGCTVSPNTIGDMSSTAIAAWDNSVVTIQGCTVENFGRIGIYANNATLNIVGNTIIGQPYASASLVNYGIEIEDYTGFSIATITNNNIYNCGNPSSPPTWSSAGIIADIFRYYAYYYPGQEGSCQPSTVQIEYNNIHNNFEAIELVGNAMSYAHYNNIYGNQWGVWTDTDENGNSTYFDAQYNWWGSSSGPNSVNPNDADPTYVNVANYLTSEYAPLLYINPTSVNKTPGDVNTDFTVSVTLSNFVNLMGLDIQLTWDSSLITLVSVDYTTTLNALWGAGQWSEVYTQQSAGSYELAATSTSSAASYAGASNLFTLTFQVEAPSSNFPTSTPIHFNLVKLSDNTTPTPNPIIPTTVTDGTYTISGIVPGLEFKVRWYNGNSFVPVTTGSPYHFECSQMFFVDVYVTNAVDLTGYDLTINFDNTLVAYNGNYGGIFGTNNAVYNSGTSSIEAYGSGSAWTGSEGLLVSLMFHVQFAATPAHIWNSAPTHPNYETFPISITSATLTFTTGTISFSGISIPAALNIEIDFIRGDVDCNGAVNIADISDVAYYYGQAAPAQYDLNSNGIIDIYDIVTIATNYGYIAPGST